MPSFRTGVVREVLGVATDGTQRLVVDVDGAARRAVLYRRWAAPAEPGHTVVVNTTAVDLDLGTGGDDFVVWNASVSSYDSGGGGHIMKLRYTPAQCDVLAVEAPESPHHEVMATATSLDGAPVVATSVHSQLLPALCGLRGLRDDARVAYVMSDGAALEAGYSDTLRRLREIGWICGVVTAGHAIGGDLESVSLHSGLLAARHVLRADVVIAGVGPGVVGTSTPYGTTALELGTIALAACGLGGRSVVCVRLSETDPRPRHRGLSHHVVSALRIARPVEGCAEVVVPAGWREEVAPALEPWTVLEREASDLDARLAEAAGLGLIASHMGRGFEDDRLFFAAAAAAGVRAAELSGT